MPSIRLALALALCLPFIAGEVHSQNPATRIHETPSPVVKAIARNGSVTIDGSLNESAWSGAGVATGFVQLQPSEGKPVTQNTEVRFLYDAAALYIGARMYDSLGAKGVKGDLVRRDRIGGRDAGDYVQFVFDTFHDHLSRTIFTVNPAGVKGDAVGPGGSNPDNSWDPVWEVATKIDSLGWTAEFRIPLNQIRFSAAADQTWGVQIWRFVSRINEIQMYSYWKSSDIGGPSRFAHLEGLNFPKRPRGTEIVPYVVGSSAFVRPADRNNPFTRPSEYKYRVGADLKYLLTSNLTLDATINPDFGQVEVDPAVVNLSAFETFFPEKRPFFVEGGGIFGFGSFNCYFCSNVSSNDLLYSRRIGRAPQGTAAGTYVDNPENSTILAAAKITGRTAKGYSIGVLDALTRSEKARVLTVNATDGSRVASELEVEPRTNYFVGRLKRDLRGGSTTVGGFVSSVLRSFDNAALAQRLDKHAEEFGVDWFHAWKQREYSFMGNYAVSNLGGDPLAVARLQRSSARYFQRPDRQSGGNGLFSDRFDTLATRLGGYGGYARIGKDGGLFNWESMVNFRSPGYEVNDISFLTRADYFSMNANVARSQTKPGRFYRNYFLVGGAQQQFNYDGDLTDRQYHVGNFGQLKNYWNLNFFYIRRPETADDRLTRGGPVVNRKGFRFMESFISSDRRKKISYSTVPNISIGEDGSRSYGLNLDVTMRPRSNVQLTVGPRYNYSTSNNQFLRSAVDSSNTAFFGRRYIFAYLQQRATSMNTRLNVTMTPAMTLELFAQPFISAGDYSRYQEFVAPRQSARRVFTDVTSSGSGSSRVDSIHVSPTNAIAIPNPNFNFRSLRGNAVFRWEYRPGSTMFVVWQQTRQDSAPYGDFSFSRDRAALFSAHPDNIFQVKMNYWMSF